MISSDSKSDPFMERIVEAIKDTPIAPFPDPPLTFNFGQAPAPLPSAPGFASLTKRLTDSSAFVLATCLLLLCSLFLWHLNTPTAIAQVQSAVRGIEAIEFSLQTQEGDNVLDRRRVQALQGHGIRAEGATSLHIFNSREGQMLAVNHATQSAIARPVYDSDAMQRMLASALGKLASLDPIQTTQVEHITRNGREILQLRSIWDGSNVTVEADLETKLPIHIEVDRGKNESGQPIRELLSDFRFDAPLAPELFAISAPEGYAYKLIERRPLDEASRDYVLSDFGLGPITWGMSFDQVVATLGQPDSVTTRPGMEPVMKDGRPVLVPGQGAGIKLIPADPPFELVTLHYDSRGFRITLHSTSGVKLVRCYDNRIASPSCRRFQGKSSDGLRLGMSQAEVLEVLEVDAVPLTGDLSFRDGRLASMSRSSR